MLEARKLRVYVNRTLVIMMGAQERNASWILERDFSSQAHLSY